jgi:hypothetical protein
VVGNRGPKLATSPGIAVVKMLGAEGAQPPPRKGPEAAQRLMVDVRASKGQCAARRLFDDEIGFPRPFHLRRNAGRDKRARSDPGHGKSVCCQPLVGVGDSIATEAGLFGQGARRRQRFAGFRDPADDGVTKRLIETVLRRRALVHMGTEQIEW